MIILKPSIQQQFAGQIWRMLIDPQKELLFTETRDVESRQVSFSGFDLNSGKVTFIDFIPDESWLTGMEGCFEGVLFLHGYESAQSPVHKGITAIDGATGNILWKNFTYAIQHISASGPIAYNTQIQPPKLFVLNAQTGAALRGFDVSVDIDQDQNMKVPHLIDTLDDNFKAHIEGEVVGNIHYIEHNSFRIVSLHALVKTNLSQILLIMQGEELVYEDLLLDEIQKLQPEAFIMQQNRLIYIKNRIELKVLNL
ncbi:MAG: DUF4905 domain-containing protein [Mucilaginibacter sp.]|uniref:DUF4905 domain-containing protein n=1 Tax=Mucilaginibacter sp. TaxID=1882438 RepID=UPI003264C427